MTENTNRCPGCFQAKEAGVAVCPRCHYDESADRSREILPHWTVLNNKYVVGRMLGKRGGFGVTYLAWDQMLAVRVAIKEYLPSELCGRTQNGVTVVTHSLQDQELFGFGLKQFLQEARLVAGFNHLNLVRVRDFFEANGTGYMVMDY